MLYTIVPYEVVYPEQIPAPEYSYKNGVIIEWRRDPYGRKVKSRVISSRLSDYL